MFFFFSNHNDSGRVIHSFLDLYLPKSNHLVASLMMFQLCIVDTDSGNLCIFCFTCTSLHMHQGFGLQGIKLQYRYTFEIKKKSYISIKYLKKKNTLSYISWLETIFKVC